MELSLFSSQDIEHFINEDVYTPDEKVRDILINLFNQHHEDDINRFIDHFKGQFCVAIHNPNSVEVLCRGLGNTYVVCQFRSENDNFSFNYIQFI